MSEEYRFLRFESAGLSTILFLIITMCPLCFDIIKNLIKEDITIIVAIIASIFLLSLPFGYIEHQLVVNKYRSHEINRIIINILNDLVLNAQEKYLQNNNSKIFFNQFNQKMKISFLTELFDTLLCYNNKLNDLTKKRLSSLWSHFYARKAVGYYAPIITMIIYIPFFYLNLFLYGNHINYINIIISVLLLIIIIIIGFTLIDPYTEKLWFEINFLEMSFLLSELNIANKIVEKNVYYLLKHPKYLRYNQRNWSWDIDLE